MENRELKQRIFDITVKHKLSHLTSCFTMVDILAKIYDEKKDDEPFILSNGHAGLALYVILEKHYGSDAEELLLRHGIHPNFNVNDKIFCSTGSLGLGITVAVGYAIADKTRNVYCTISDGESFEGSVWESLNFIHNYGLDNLKVHLNLNGFSAYDTVNKTRISSLARAFLPSINIWETDCTEMPYLEGIAGHYYTPKEGDSL